MSLVKTVWGLLFRLFPCPTQVGLRRLGNPGRDSPVLVTCNFDLTVKRLTRALRAVDAWLLVGESKGVNVWCAAGGHEFNTDSVVSVVKTSGIADLVDHRTLILPPLGAPGIHAADVEKRTGWSVRWGPVQARDIPRYLARGAERDESMKRASYDWRERLDTALGSLFVFYVVGAVAFALFGRALLIDYLLVAAIVFAGFMLASPWLPTRHGLTKALIVSAGFGVLLLASLPALGPAGTRLRAELLIAIGSLLLYGSELGGLSSTMASDLDPFLARLGIGAVGNVALAGTIRTELLNGYRVLSHRRERCDSCHSCIEVCPQGVWELGADDKSLLADLDACTACTACLMQCRSGAIKAGKTKTGMPTSAQQQRAA